MTQLPDQSQFGDYGEWPGRDVLDSGGERLGDVREIYLDRETGRPEWVLVQVESDESRFVPLADANVESRAIRVAHPATLVRSAPSIGAEPRIDQTQERELYAHYQIGYSSEESGSGLPDDNVPPPEPPTEVHEPVAFVPPAPEPIDEPAPFRTDDLPGAFSTPPDDDTGLILPEVAPPSALFTPPVADTPATTAATPDVPQMFPEPAADEPSLFTPPEPAADSVLRDATASTFSPPPPRPAPEPPAGPFSSPAARIAAVAAAAVLLLLILRRRR